MHRRELIYKETLKSYKFYLSFENTKCEEYITEKFFTALSTEESIPIALGGASIQDYINAAPPHSYIHVDEHTSVRSLAKKLEYLSENETAYKEYFWWTKYYRVTGVWDHYRSAQCDLCEKSNLAKQGKLQLSPINLFRDLDSENTCNYNTTY